MKSYYLGTLDKRELAMRKSDRSALCSRIPLILLDRVWDHMEDMYVNEILDG